MKASDPRGGYVIVIGMVLIVVCSWILAVPVFTNLLEMGVAQYWTTGELSAMQAGGVPSRALLWLFYSYLDTAGFYLGIALTAIGIYMEARPAPRFLPPPPSQVGLCPKCGTMNPPTSKFCSECATKL